MMTMEKSQDVVVLILCGLPGSGKSTLAKSIIQKYNSSSINEVLGNDDDGYYDDATDSNASNAASSATTDDNGYELDVLNNNNDNVVLIDYDEITLRLAKDIRESKQRDENDLKDITTTTSSSKRSSLPSSPTETETETTTGTTGGVYEFVDNNFDFDQEELQAWRMTRKEALVKLDHELQQILVENRIGTSTSSRTSNDQNDFNNKVTTTESPKAKRKPKLIIMDDNFHLRSMRRDVYKTCQNFIVNHHHHHHHNNNNNNEQKTQQSNPFLIGLVILHMDIPMEQCLQNNERRKQNNSSSSTTTTTTNNNNHHHQYIPPRIIQNMNQVFEQPNGKIHKFERCSITISKQFQFNNINNNHCSNDQEDDVEQTTFYKTLFTIIQKSLLGQYQIQKPTTKSLEQIQLEREETMKSKIHYADLLLRSLVGAVCKGDKSLAKKANMGRKVIMNEYKQRLKEEALEEDEEEDEDIDDGHETFFDHKTIVNEFEGKIIDCDSCSSEKKSELKKLIGEALNQFKMKQAKNRC